MNSLAEAISLIADGMEEEAKDLAGDGADAGRSFCSMTLKGYVKQLRIAVKASGAD